MNQELQYEYADVHPVVGRQTGSFERTETRISLKGVNVPG